MTEKELSSERPEPRERFLSKFLEAARACGVFDSAELLKRFPARRIMEGYADEPDMRAKLFDATTGMPGVYMRDKSVEECIQFIETAWDIDNTTSDDIFKFVTLDELVRVHDAAELFTFLEDTKWDERDTPEHRALMGILLCEYRKEELDGSDLKCLRAIEAAIGVVEMVEHLGIKIGAQIVERARSLADEQPGNIAFTVDAMFGVVTMDLLAEHLPIPVLMRPIRAAAERFGWVEKSVSEDELDKDLEALINPETTPPPPPDDDDDDGEDDDDGPELVMDDEDDEDSILALDDPNEIFPDDDDVEEDVDAFETKGVLAIPSPKDSKAKGATPPPLRGRGKKR